MIEFIVHIFVTSVLILVISSMFEDIEVRNWKSAFYVAAILGLANALIKPILIFVTLPLTILTLGLFILVINAVLFYAATALVDGVKVKGLWTTFFGSLSLTILNMLVAWIF